MHNGFVIGAHTYKVAVHFDEKISMIHPGFDGHRRIIMTHAPECEYFEYAEG